MESIENCLDPTAYLERGHYKLNMDSMNITNYSIIPKHIDSKIAIHDTDNTLKSTIIKSGTDWTRKRQKMKTSSLTRDDIETEKNKAMDLLDSLSRSGSFPISYTELHVIVGITHCFENNIMGTIIQDNINPIEKLEKSTILLASSIYNGVVPTKQLVQDPNDLQRLIVTFPSLLDSPESSSQVENHDKDRVIEQSNC